MAVVAFKSFNFTKILLFLRLGLFCLLFLSTREHLSKYSATSSENFIKWQKSIPVFIYHLEKVEYIFVICDHWKKSKFTLRKSSILEASVLDSDATTAWRNSSQSMPNPDCLILPSNSFDTAESGAIKSLGMPILKSGISMPSWRTGKHGKLDRISQK